MPPDENKVHACTSMDYNVVNFSIDDRDAKPLLTCIINYDKNPSIPNGWAPANWTLDSVSKNKHEGTSCRVLKAKINQPIDPKEFDITFPAGTKVLDFTRNEDQPQQFAVDNSGVMHQEVFGTGIMQNTPVTIESSGETKLRWGLMAVTITAIVILSMLIMRKRQSRSATPITL